VCKCVWESYIDICFTQVTALGLSSDVLNSRPWRVPGLDQITWQIVLTKKMRGHGWGKDCTEIEKQSATEL